ncbi:MAG: hypothetical protein WAW03_11760 [Anaerolineae bacterium]|uniref:hypothetical protein n=1 Tax=Candidatus Amarolinea dominans TaxID=3140696 RepID=UPI001D684332|nr:hypothetical protein [Anaerolineae bacterium]
MHGLNRLIVFLFFLTLFVCLLGVAVFPFGALSLAQQIVSNLNETLTQAYYDFGPQFRLGQVLVVVAAALVLIPFIWLQVRRTRPATVRVQTNSGAATLTADSVMRRLAWHLDQLADVVGVTSEVKAHGTSVDIKLSVRTTPDIEVPMKTEEILAVTREVVEQRMGLRLGKVEVQIDHAPYAERATIEKGSAR